jgi:tape measure domain-containing protein
MAMAYDGSIKFDTRMDASGFQQGANRLTDIVQGCGAFKLLEKGLQMVSNSVDAAVTRYDTLQKFPKVLEQMGFSADSASAATQKLSDGVQGLPTTLDSVVSTAQRITVLTGNLEGATNTTLALNDAFLASGSSSSDASRGLEQYVQMLSSGKVDMQSWRTLQETMGLALNETAKSFGFAGKSAQNDLYAALQSGEITFDQFNAKLVELDGGVDGFAARAKTSTGGIGTAWTNLQTAVVRGSTNILSSIDKGFSQTKFKSIENIIQTAGKSIYNAMHALSPVFEVVAANMDKIVVAAAGILAAKTAYTAFGGAVKVVTAAQNLFNAAAATSGATGILLTPTINANTLAEARATAMKKLGTTATEEQIVAEMAANGVITTKTFVLGGMSAGMGVASIASGVLTAATTALNAAMSANPAGLVIAGIAGVVAAIGVAAVIIGQQSDAYKDDTASAEDLSDAQKSLTESTDSAKKTHEDNMAAIKQEADVSQQLAGQIDKLSGSENKSATDKKQLASLVAQLNDEQDGLNLSYDAENDQLSLNTEQVNAYIDAKRQIAEANELQSQANTLLETENTLNQQRADLETQQQEYDSQLADRTINQEQYNILCQQLNDTRAGYITQEADIAAQKTDIDTQLSALDTTTAQNTIDSMESVAAAQEEEMQRRKDALQTYTDAATNMYDQIDTKSKISVDDMITNLQHNQDAVSTWADNLVALGQRGLDQGLLQQLRDAGPESAGTVQALVDTTDDKLTELSDVYRNGGDTATNALMTELGLPEVTNSGADMVDKVASGVDADSSLKESTTRMVQQAKTAAATAVASSNFNGIGKNMIAGITAGVNAGTSSLVNTMRAAVQKAVDAAKSAAQIHSPSRVMRDVIGLNMMKGWELGIIGGQGLVSDSISDTVRQAEDAAGQAVLSMPKQQLHSFLEQAQSAAAAQQSGIGWSASIGSGTPGTAGSGTSLEVNQTFHINESLSEAEISRESTDAIERAKWKLP